MIKIIGIRVTDRVKEAGLMQKVLSKHSGLITTRLGFHEVSDSLCSREGFVLLHVNGQISQVRDLADDLTAIGGIEIKMMDFTGADDNNLNALGAGEAITVLGILARDGSSSAPDIQRILTLHGCSVRTRLGIREIYKGEPAGLIILELVGPEEEKLSLVRNLAGIANCELQGMVFGEG